MSRLAPGEPANSGEAFGRITVERAPQNRSGYSWHIEVPRPAVPGRKVATAEHMNVNLAEIIALYDHLSAIVLGLREDG
jgi:hypothetical protein